MKKIDYCLSDQITFGDFIYLWIEISLPINLLYLQQMIFFKLPIYLTELSKLNLAVVLYWSSVLDFLKIFCLFNSVFFLN